MGFVLWWVVDGVGLQIILIVGLGKYINRLQIE